MNVKTARMEPGVIEVALELYIELKAEEAKDLIIIMMTKIDQ